MKKEFLANFQVAGQPLPAEVVEAILQEHQRAVNAATAPFADYDSLKEQLQTAKDGLKAFEGVDVSQLQQQVTQLQNDLNEKETAHQAQLAQIAFDRDLDAGITAIRGRNGKAIRALLDLEKLQGSQNREKDIKEALEALKQESGYLFDDEGAPPPYSAGAGTGGVGRQVTQEDLAKMSMAEYRAYRSGK